MDLRADVSPKVLTPDATGFKNLCDTIVYSHEEGIEKPDPRAYVLLGERLGVPLDEILFLDDLRANVEAARLFGMQAVLFRGDIPETIVAMETLLDGP